MDKTAVAPIGKYDRIIYLLEHLLAVELLRAGLPQTEIAKHLKINTAKANAMLKGTKKGSAI